MASLKQQDLTSFMQISTSNFYYYKVIMVVDEII